MRKRERLRATRSRQISHVESLSEKIKRLRNHPSMRVSLLTKQRVYREAAKGKARKERKPRNQANNFFPPFIYSLFFFSFYNVKKIVKNMQHSFLVTIFGFELIKLSLTE